MKPRKIENSQKAMIHAAAKELGIDHKDVLWKMFKVRSCLDISYLQAEKVRAHYKKLGWKPKRKKSPSSRSNDRSEKLPKNVKRMTTGPQRHAIREMYWELGWSIETFYGWCSKQIWEKFPGEKFKYPPTQEKASAVISRMTIILKKDREKYAAE